MRGFIPPQTPEESVLYKKYQKMCESCSAYGREQFSTFLNMRQKELFIARSNRFPDISLNFGYGFEGDGERCIACIRPEYDNGDIVYPIDIIRTAIPSSSSVNHRDFLGAAMGLMIKRDYIGDIIVKEDECFMICHESVSSLIINELKSVGHISVKFDWYHEPIEYHRSYSQTGSATVASLRLDSVLSAVLRVSRSKSSDMIKAGLVEVNHLNVLKSDFEIDNEDVLSIRGQGKYLIGFDGNTSRKNRYYINFSKY